MSRGATQRRVGRREASSVHALLWSHGAATVSTTAAMLLDLCFDLDSRPFRPLAPVQWADDDTVAHLPGRPRVPDAPGLGLGVDLDRIAPYLRTIDIRIDGVRLYASPDPARTVAIDA